MAEDEKSSKDYEFENFESSTDEKNHKDQIERISHNLAEDFESNWKPVILGLGIISVLILVFAFYNLKVPENLLSDQVSDNVIEGNITNVNLTDRSVEPSRPTISREDGIRFRNLGSQTFNLSFDRDIESFLLEPGDQKVVDINSITYYNATPVNDGRKIIAGVYVE